MVTVKDLKKGLGGFCLRNVNMELPSGYIMGLIGPNGSGKSTLMKCLLGLYRPDEGNVCINGMYYPQNEKQIKDGIGFVFQEDLFVGNLSLTENGAFYGKYYSNYSETLLLEYLERFQLEPGKKLKKFSKGEKLKFQFAFALSHQPKLLLLDEPTGSFDPDFREEFFYIITDFVKDGDKSVILATHITEDLERIADYITLLYKGKLKFSMDRNRLGDMYRIVTGEDYKIRLIDSKKVFGMEKGEFSTRALVKHNEYAVYDRELDVSVPSLEDIMYFLCKKSKGDKADA